MSLPKGGSNLTAMIVPAYDKVVAHQAFLQTRLGGAQVVAALEASRARTGAYPDRLDQLVPDYLPELPLDRFSAGGRYRYQKQADGYTLETASPELAEVNHGSDTYRY